MTLESRGQAVLYRHPVLAQISSKAAVIVPARICVAFQSLVGFTQLSTSQTCVVFLLLLSAGAPLSSVTMLAGALLEDSSSPLFSPALSGLLVLWALLTSSSSASKSDSYSCEQV